MRTILPGGAGRERVARNRVADDAEILQGARELLGTEAEALGRLVEVLDDDFVAAVRLLAACKGRVITTGVGKAGIIAQKVSATMASTGTPSLFLHPTEALHGDLGRVTADDIVLAFSNSGTTEEVLRLVGPVKDIGAATVALTSDADSPLARHAEVALDYGKVTEACPLGLAPTTSTTVMLALGDALAMAILSEHAFDKEQFARFHPAGELGRSLMKVKEVMRTGRQLPLVPAGASLSEAVDAMNSTDGRPGSVLVARPDGHFAGFFTDGDLRRGLLTRRPGSTDDYMDQRIDDVMTVDPVTVGPEQLVGEAMHLLRERKIDQLAVVDDEGRPVGLLDIQDLLEIRALS